MSCVFRDIIGKHLYEQGAREIEEMERTSKKAKHMGMNLSEVEHEKWHIEHPEMTPDQHKAFMKKMGISEEEDKEWHKTRETTIVTTGEPSKKMVNPFAIGGAFLAYCVKQGWLIQEGSGRDARYFVTRTGEVELRKYGVNA
ncbi:MAG: hypothetical protein WED05_11800 [Candidatus Atabeyarchaeum deiterrae]